MNDKSSEPQAQSADQYCLPVTMRPGESDAQALGRSLAEPAICTGIVMHGYRGLMGADDADLSAAIDAIRETSARVKGGDLSDMEAMLVGQATALQTMFVNLGRRAQTQEHRRNFEALLGLALKCQAQSRATIDSLVNLKYPRTTVIAKQANVNQGGQQQVNNGVTARTKQTESEQSKLLEVDHGQPCGWLDAGATGAPAGSYPQVEAVGAVNRPTVSRRKGQGGA